MAYTVKNVPILLKPFFYLYAYLGGLFLSLLCFFLHFTCRIRFEGKEKIQDLPHFILCLWHYTTLSYFVVFLRYPNRHVLLNHPLWYMKAVHVWARILGVSEIILGSSGNSGREGAQKLVEALKEGASTTMWPDGPKGPPHVLNKGVLHIAQQSGLPIVPVQIHFSHFFSLKTWDKKKIPFPFSTITVTYQKPIWVSAENFDQAQEELSKLL